MRLTNTEKAMLSLVLDMEIMNLPDNKLAKNSRYCKILKNIRRKIQRDLEKITTPEWNED